MARLNREAPRNVPQEVASLNSPETNPGVSGTLKQAFAERLEEHDWQ